MKFKIEYLIKVSYSENLQVCDMRSYNVVNPYSDTLILFHMILIIIVLFCPKRCFFNIRG